MPSTTNRAVAALACDPARTSEHLSRQKLPPARPGHPDGLWQRCAEAA